MRFIVRTIWNTNALCWQNAENLYIETGGTLDIKGLKQTKWRIDNSNEFSDKVANLGRVLRLR
jgi:thiamine biosynthesis lipoprotein ApbE